MLSAEPKTEADNSYRDLHYSGYHKTESNNCFTIHCFEENPKSKELDSTLKGCIGWGMSKIHRDYGIARKIESG